MDLKSLKELAQNYTVAELNAAADALENTGECALSPKLDLHELMSDLLQASEVRQLVDQGQTLQEAVRTFSQRVRGTLSPK